MPADPAPQCLSIRSRGLFAPLPSMQILPQDLQRSMHYLATIRNKLVHE